jgi:hypothetical protein
MITVDYTDRLRVIGGDVDPSSLGAGCRAPTAGPDLSDAAVTITIDQGAVRRLPAATLSGNRVVTLGTTNAAARQVLRIVRDDATANTLTIANGGGGGGNVVVLPASKTGFCEAVFDGTDWKLYGCGAI